MASETRRFSRFYRKYVGISVPGSPSINDIFGNAKNVENRCTDAESVGKRGAETVRERSTENVESVGKRGAETIRKRSAENVENRCAESAESAESAENAKNVKNRCADAEGVGKRGAEAVRMRKDGYCGNVFGRVKKTD